MHPENSLHAQPHPSLILSFAPLDPFDKLIVEAIVLQNIWNSKIHHLGDFMPLLTNFLLAQIEKINFYLVNLSSSVLFWLESSNFNFSRHCNFSWNRQNNPALKIDNFFVFFFFSFSLLSMMNILITCCQLVILENPQIPLFWNQNSIISYIFRRQ